VVTENTVVDLGSTPGKVTFTFQEAPWPEVLREFASWCGLSLDLTDTPPGYFNYFDSRQHTPTEAIDILNGYLLPRGYVALRRDRFLVVIKTDNEVLASMVPSIDVSELDQRGANELVRIVVPVDEISPEMAAEEIKDLLGPHGKATPLESSSSLVIQGFGSTLRQALEMLDKSTPPVTDDKLDFRAFTLEHLPAFEAEQQIRGLFGLDAPAGSKATNVSAARYENLRAEYYRSRTLAASSARDSKSREANPPPIPLLKQVAMNMQVSSLERNNSLLVTATPEGLALIEEILESIDVPQGESAADLVHGNKPFLRVYRIDDVDEQEVAKTLDVLIPGVLVNEDSRHDTLHILATARQHEEVDRVIRTLDFSPSGDRQLEVITLRRSNPEAMQRMLTGMFIYEDRDQRPVIQSDLDTQTLIIRADARQLEQIHRTLASYGESTDEQAVAESRVRRVVVGARDAETIADKAARILEDDSDFRHSIRVVIPGQSASEDSKTQSSASASDGALEDNSPKKQRQRETSRKAKTIRPEDVTGRGTKNAFGTRAVQLTGNNPADRAPKQTAKRRPRVNIEAHGDELFMYSDDASALDEVEATVRDLIRQMPERTTWTVFYLRVAEASEVASRLYDLTIDYDSFTSTSSLTYSSSELEQMLRIVPDERTNSIFVSGPTETVTQIEGLLEYLDADDVPESFRERKPHSILVEHADVNEVAEMLRDLYKDFLTDPAIEAKKAAAQANPKLAAQRPQPRTLPTSKSPGVRLTIAVDTRTNELLVSCNEQLFREIVKVVEERDKAVVDTEPTVQVMPLTSELPANVVEMLEGMSPKIKAEIVDASELEAAKKKARK
jgi:type II secretory pathway component GspD/PulD (secretin)